MLDFNFFFHLGEVTSLIKDFLTLIVAGLGVWVANRARRTWEIQRKVDRFDKAHELIWMAWNKYSETTLQAYMATIHILSFRLFQLDLESPDFRELMRQEVNDFAERIMTAYNSRVEEWETAVFRSEVLIGVDRKELLGHQTELSTLMTLFNSLFTMLPTARTVEDFDRNLMHCAKLVGVQEGGQIWNDMLLRLSVTSKSDEVEGTLSDAKNRAEKGILATLAKYDPNRKSSDSRINS